MRLAFLLAAGVVGLFALARAARIAFQVYREPLLPHDSFDVAYDVAANRPGECH